MKKLGKFKIRCSGIYQIMGASKNELTDKQRELMENLQEKEKLTEKQALALQELEDKDAKPIELSDGTKSYLKQWYIQDQFGRRKEFSNKYTEKGTLVENQSIDLFSRVTGTKGACKNEQRFENEWCTGEPDILLMTSDKVVDIKSSWDIFSFPMLKEEQDNKTYWWQLQGYMFLCGKERAELAYCLVDTPEYLIESEFNRQKWAVLEEEHEAFKAELRKNMTFSDIDDALKVKIFKVERDNNAIERMKKRVMACREYLEQLHQEFNQQ